MLGTAPLASWLLESLAFGRALFLMISNHWPIHLEHPFWLSYGPDFRGAHLVHFRARAWAVSQSNDLGAAGV